MKTYRVAVIGCSRMGAFMVSDDVPDAHPYSRPQSHAAGFAACERTEIVACSDLVPEVMERFGQRYGVPGEKQYTDYRQMIEKESLDIVSVATQPEHRAEIVVYTAEHGVPAIYAEKAMAASMSEADAMVEAVERNGVFFNLGARRRFYMGYNKMREVIESGDLGPLQSIVMQQGGPLFNRGSHNLDLILYLNGDQPAAWVQGHLPNGDTAIQGDIMVEDPNPYHGIIQFHNGVTAYTVLAPFTGHYEAICERGSLACANDRQGFQLRRHEPGGDRALEFEEFPEFQPVSPTTKIIEDLVHALDTGEPVRGGVRAARAGTELQFAIAESHVRGGARVELPLKDSRLKLQRRPTVLRSRLGRS